MYDNAHIEERKLIHSKRQDDLNKRQLSNSENFDKSILTYSTAGLALSLGVLKDFVPVARAHWMWLLYASWILFTCVVTITLLSFILSQLGIKRQIEIDERYYLKLDDAAADEPNRFAVATEWCSYLSGICFVVALGCTVLFVIHNL